MPLQGENLFSSLDAAGDCVKKKSLVIPRALVRMRTGEAPLSGHVTGKRCLVTANPVCGGLSHP